MNVRSEGQKEILVAYYLMYDEIRSVDKISCEYRSGIKEQFLDADTDSVFACQVICEMSILTS